MPSLNFSVFVDKVVDGSKPHSIRAGERFNVGDDLSFFTGMRTKSCRRLRPNTACTAAVPISIFTNRRVVLGAGSRWYGKGALTEYEVLQLAMRDGFPGSEHFFEFFFEQIRARDNGREFRGQLVEWDPRS